MLRLSRFRSPSRDRATDVARVDAIRLAIATAIQGITVESNGLSRRLEDTRGLAGSIMGNEDGIFFVREPQDEENLKMLERQLLSGAERLDYLKKQKSLLSEILARVGRYPLRPVTTSSTLGEKFASETP